MFTPHDRNILRDLARRVAEIAALPMMAERKARWKAHHRLQPGRPMLLVFPEGAWCELLPAEALRCEDTEARAIEFDLRARIYGYEHFASDNVVEAEWIVPKVIHSTGWGVTAQWKRSPAERGAYTYDPVITCPADLDKLTAPEVTYDAPATLARQAQLQELFGDILEVKLKGVTHLSFHLMALYCSWRGLEQVMLDMHEEPAMLHEAMARLEDGHHRLVRQYIEQQLLSLNNDNAYHSSGGLGYTDELPAPGFDPARVRPCDLWASAEAQEMAQVSPEMHAEFILPYEKRLLAPCGLNGYGCCEDLTRKLDDVLTIPRLRRVSIAPWADVAACAERLQRRAIFSWKPQPAYLVGDFTPEFLRDYIRQAVTATRGCVLELILKDTHTCEAHPERFDQWTRVAREVIDA